MQRFGRGEQKGAILLLESFDSTSNNLDNYYRQKTMKKRITKHKESSTEKSNQRSRDSRSRQRARVLDSLTFEAKEASSELASMNKRYRRVFLDKSGDPRATFIRVPKEIVMALRRLRNEKRGYFDNKFARIAVPGKPTEVNNPTPKTVKKGGACMWQH